MKKYENKTAVILCRVSSKEQEKEGYSLPSQEKLLKSYSDKEKLNVVKTYTFSESARASSERVYFKQMMEYVKKQNIHVIVCEKVDRATRNLKDTQVLYDWLEGNPDRQIHSVKDSIVLHKNSKSQEKLNWDIRVIFAKNYVDNLSEEVKKGQIEKLEKGWLPTSPPLGYKTIGEEGKRIHIPDEATKHFAKSLFELYGSGTYTLSQLVDLLFEEGLRTPTGKKYSKSMLYRCLQNPFYIGYNRWNGNDFPGNQETFISPSLYETVQSRLKRNGSQKFIKHNHLLRSMAVCKECGGTITWELKKGTVYGHCGRRQGCSQTKCGKEHEFEEKIINEMENLVIKNKRVLDWVSKALKENHKDEINAYNYSVEELTKQEEKITERLSQIYDDKLDGKIDESFYNLKMEQYTTERTEIQKQRTRLADRNTKYYEIGSLIYDIAQNAPKIYKECKDVDKKRKILGIIFRTFQQENGELVELQLSKPFETLKKAVSITNSSNLVKNEELQKEILELGDFVAVEANKESFSDDCSPWLADRDSNPNSRDQNPVCYPYTIRHRPLK